MSAAYVLNLSGLTPYRDAVALQQSLAAAVSQGAIPDTVILLEHEPAWTRFQEAVLDFTGAGAPAGEPSVFASLSSRERQVLTLIADGLSNTDIAERLAISEKTVRNHTSNVFDKLGVWSRAQAIVFARDRGFR